jgi:hypothetical protein
MSARIYIDLTKMQVALKHFVRNRAKKEGSNIIYVRNCELVKENPKTHKKSGLKYISRQH